MEIAIAHHLASNPGAMGVEPISKLAARRMFDGVKASLDLGESPSLGIERRGATELGE